MGMSQTELDCATIVPVDPHLTDAEKPRLSRQSALILDRDPIFASLDMLIASGHGDDVRYVDPLQVSVRRDRNRLHGPKPLSVVEAIRLSGVSVCPQTVRDRLHQGFTLYAAIHTPLKQVGRWAKK